MKIKLIFDSENKEDMDEYQMMMKARRMWLALDDIRDKLRDAYKYENPYVSAQDAVEKLYDYYFEVIKDRELGEDLK